jgi:hypothetical protein
MVHEGLEGSAGSTVHGALVGFAGWLVHETRKGRATALVHGFLVVSGEGTVHVHSQDYERSPVHAET